jgi:sodium transport system permease protein
MPDSTSPSPSEPDFSDQPAKGTRRLKRFAFGALGRLAMKELRETLRDRRTIVTLLLMPLIVYPLLSLAFHRFLVLYFEPETPAIRIGFASQDDLESFRMRILRGDQILSEAKEAEESSNEDSDDETRTGIPSFLGSGSQELADFPALKDLPLEGNIFEDLEEELRRGRIDIGVETVERDGVTTYQLFYHQGLPNSQRALRFAVERLRAVNESYGREALRRIGQPGYPAEFAKQPISAGAVGGISLAIVLPLILVLMTITGAVYPAIDLTAGERERGTLEALLASPVSRLGLLMAKYIAVVVVAQLTAIVNLFAMIMTVTITGLAPHLFPGGELSIIVILQVLGLLFLFAAFFSAVLLVLTSMARSFKEAQAYLIPIMMMSISPALVSLVPDVKLASWFHVPLLNMVLFARDLIEGTADPRYGALTVATTLIYTATAAAIAARLFGTDTVLYGSQSSWKDMFRRPPRPVDGPSFSAAMGALAVLFPAFFVTSGLLSFLKLPTDTTLVVSGIATLFLFALFPVGYCAAYRIRLDKTFPLSPHWAGILVAAIWGMSAWMFAHEILVVSDKYNMVMLDPEKFAAIEELLAKWRTLPLMLVLLSLAVAPGFCEEIVFRGMLFRGLEREFSPKAAWIWSSLLFGAFHMVSGNALTIERFLPSVLLGFFLGGLRMRTGSLLPGMFMHVLSNGLLLCAAYYRDELMEAGWGMTESEHLPATWLVGATVAVVLGAGILAMSRPNRSGSTS